MSPIETIAKAPSAAPTSITRPEAVYSQPIGS
jgi:hypothetical protein